MQRTFVIGDIHGADEAFRQVLDRASFDRHSDRLICLGDVCDRRPGVRQCIDELLKIKHLVMIKGNHDLWALEWMMRGGDPGSVSEAWYMQGGSDTIDSYRDGIPESHVELLRSAKYYHVENSRMFVHGGFDHRYPVEKQDPNDLVWDRSLVHAAAKCKDPTTRLGNYLEIFVGHTPTINFIRKVPGMSDHIFKERKSVAGSVLDYPLKLCNVWLMDTGAGWSGGRLSMMNPDTGTVVRSDVLK